jgi:phosphatidylglycerophosphatase A
MFGIRRVFMFFHRFRTGRKGPFLNKFVIFVATGGYAGFFPVAPGTVGALVGLLLFYLFSNFSLAIYLLSTTALFFLGAWAAEKAEISFGRKDSPKIVIDEVVGYLVTMVLIPFTFGNALGGFLFFRLFDIIKPPPARKIDRQMQGGFAVILDDAVAGLYANLSMHLLLWGSPQFFQDLDRWLRSFI